MTYEYRCENHRYNPDYDTTSSFDFEIFFKTFSEAEEYIDSAPCDCGETAKRIPSSPLGFGLYGDPAGYGHPSPTKRHSWKLVSSKGNANSSA